MPMMDPTHESWLHQRAVAADQYYSDLNSATQTTHHTRMRGSNGNRNRRGGGGGGSPRLSGGGGGFQGANAIPSLNLPNTTTSGTPSSGISPIIIILFIAAAGLGGWYWWHKAHLAAKQDQKASGK